MKNKNNLYARQGYFIRLIRRWYALVLAPKSENHPLAFIFILDFSFVFNISTLHSWSHYWYNIIIIMYRTWRHLKCVLNGRRRPVAHSCPRASRRDTDIIIPCSCIIYKQSVWSYAIFRGRVNGLSAKTHTSIINYNNNIFVICIICRRWTNERCTYDRRARTIGRGSTRRQDLK